MMTNDVASDGYTGQADETTPGDEFNSLSFLISQIISGKWTITLCVVKTVTGGGVDVPCTVSVQPLVNQVDGANNPTPHGIINGVPVFRLQGGTGALIVDPIAGDIGLLACASRDISGVKNNKALSNPGSLREFDPADGLYLGGFLNAAPKQYIQITASGINLVLSSTVKIAISSGGINITVGSNTFAVTTSGFTFNGMDYLGHTHAVTTAPGETGPVVG